MQRRIAWSLVVMLAAAAPLAATAKSAKKPWLGMALVLRDQPGGGKFLYVAHVPDATPAQRAGVREGDLITAIAGKNIAFRDDLDFIEYTVKLEAGERLPLRIVRAGKPTELSLVVGELPAE